ncbi:MAG TPA: hypothetical protein EYO58_10830, partial [Flavobacteriales bacterium]|nr:hypothetical protein [Flavobacteriales bacterium]
AGCTDVDACNFDSEATLNDGSCEAFDECGVCGGDNSSCSGCTDATACNYDTSVIIDDSSCEFFFDECGICGGDNTTCADECGIPNGDNSTCADDCGVPYGDNTTCADECGVLNGDNSTCLDDCGVPNGDNSTCFISCGDEIEHVGYSYSTVQIGDQCWFSENCRYIPEGQLSGWSTNGISTTEPRYYYHLDQESAYNTYGALYNWPAVMTGDLCPSGWHIPSDGEFTELTDFLGGESVAGYAMKSTSGWEGENGSNSSGFNGLPGGFLWDEFGWLVTVGGWGCWWTSSEYDYRSMGRMVSHDDDSVVRNQFDRDRGFSARCVQD